MTRQKLDIFRLDSPTQRKKKALGKRHQEKISVGQFLCYRKPKTGGAGTWSARFVSGDKELTKTLGTADDDHLEADNDIVLSYMQAKDKAIDWFSSKAKETRRAKRGGNTIDPEIFTVADAFNFAWERKERLGRHCKGIEIDKSRAGIWILPELGDVPLMELTKGNIEVWLAKIAKSGRKVNVPDGQPEKFEGAPKEADKKRARAVTANRVLAILKWALNTAFNENDDLAESDIKACWQRVKALTVKAKPRLRILTEDEETLLINACEGSFKELVIAALETGCRYGELAALRVRDYDPDTGTIYIAESKSGKPRYVDLGERGIALFDELTARKNNPGDLMLTHRIKRLRIRDKNGVPQIIDDAWRHSDQKALIEAACERAGIEKIGFHGLRHTYASMLLRNGCLTWYVARQLGHRDEKMVEEFYGHIIPSEKTKAIRQAMAGRRAMSEPKYQKLKPKKSII